MDLPSLTCRVEQLEKRQALNMETFRFRAKELQASVSKDLEDAAVDAAGV
jgi:hypothetical protein